MFEKFTNKFLINLLTYGFGSLFLGVPFLIYWLLTEYLWLGIGAVGLFLFVVAYFTYKDIVEESEKAHKSEIQRVTSEAEIQVSIAEQNFKIAEHKENMWRQLLKERTSGFPSLFNNIAYYEKLIDDELAGYLRNKSHPAVSASEMVKTEAKRRREAEFTKRTTLALIEYYENIAPFLLDFKEEVIDDNEDAIRDYSDEEREDPVSNYLTKEEYRKLPSTDRNQMALERYWKRPKSKWLLGRIYERYVGYLHEQQGYDVEYTGIFHGYEDLGRDLVCSKGNEVIVIQCKYWSQFKTIYEKHIFQFFGTVFQYRDQNPRKKVRAIFFTTTELSELARRFAHELNIELEERSKMPRSYPCIKCNISQVDGTKIYHLPFDQQYDNTRIEVDKRELYCETVAEAEKAGFRRAYRWRGVKGD
ncbi:MAG: restriction endonuclease [Patescibacteria group bacterium]